VSIRGFSMGIFGREITFGEFMQKLLPKSDNFNLA
jgi:hypothetical protein